MVAKTNLLQMADCCISVRVFQLELSNECRLEFMNEAVRKYRVRRSTTRPCPRNNYECYQTVNTRRTTVSTPALSDLFHHNISASDPSFNEETSGDASPIAENTFVENLERKKN